MMCAAQRAADIPMSTINCCLIFLENNRDHTVELRAPPPQSHSACCSPTCQSALRLVQRAPVTQTPAACVILYTSACHAACGTVRWDR